MQNANMFEIIKVGDITPTIIKDIQAQGLRPGIKALLYNPQTAEVLLGTLPEGFPLRFNLPGGGIDAGQSAMIALSRELEEELGISSLPESMEPLPVVFHGELPFERDEFRGKYEFIVAVPNLSLESISPLPDSKMKFWPVMYWQEAVIKVRTLAYGGPEMMALYEKAFLSVPALLYR